MRVGLDVSPLRQTRAGTARHLRALLAWLDVLADVDLVRFAFGGSGRAAAFARDAAWYPFGLPRRARTERVDVLHCPTYRGPVRSAAPVVVTVHDLAVFRHPEAFNRWSRTYSRAVVPRVLAAARRVIAVSEFTRRELVELLGVPDGKIRVVPNAVGEEFEPDGAASGGDYVLAVGTLEPRKNLARLVEAARRTGVELRVVGARGWGGVEVAGNGVRWLGEVPDDRLAELYRGAVCVAYPSLYEGFGMPVLEAMACGVPVVTSAGGATEEVAGGAAVLIDPLDPGSIAAGLEEASARRDELAGLGLERARSFSWADTAAATAAVYREVAG
jgi:glycosyltransferase involved in cell wall biosynthesis